VKFESGIGQLPPLWPILFCCSRVFFIGALREAHFRRPRAKREKKKSAGAEKKERPPKRATEINLLKEKLSATPKALVLF